MNQQRRFVALLVGIGATAVGMLSKVTFPLGLPGGLLAVLVQKFTPSIPAYFAALWVGNLAFWTIGAYLYLTWKARRETAA